MRFLIKVHLAKKSASEKLNKTWKSIRIRGFRIMCRNIQKQQPGYFAVTSVLSWNHNDSTLTDRTNEFLKLWKQSKFTSFNPNQLGYERLAVTFKCRDLEVCTILYDVACNDLNEYPPYNNPDDRIKAYRLGNKCAQKALMGEEDVTNLVNSLKGPGKAFYEDTLFPISNAIIEEYIRLVVPTLANKSEFTISWNDGTFYVSRPSNIASDDSLIENIIR